MTTKTEWEPRPARTKRNRDCLVSLALGVSCFRFHFFALAFFALSIFLGWIHVDLQSLNNNAVDMGGRNKDNTRS